MENSINFTELCYHGDLSCFFKKLPNSNKCLLHTEEDKLTKNQLNEKYKILSDEKVNIIEKFILKFCG